MPDEKSILNEILREERARLARIEDYCSRANMRLAAISTELVCAGEKAERNRLDKEWEKLYGKWSEWLERKGECSLFIRKLESIIEFHDIRATYSPELYGDDRFYPPKLEEAATNG